MVTGKTVYHDGKAFTRVHVKASYRDVPREYPKTDPRTKAAHKER